MKKGSFFLTLIAISLFPYAQEMKLVLPEGHSGNIENAFISPDNKSLISHSADGIKVWSIRDKKLLYTLSDCSISILDNQCIFSNDGKKMATISGNDKIKIWNIADGSLHLELNGHTDFINSVSYSNLNNDIISTCQDETIKIWDGTTGNLKSTLSNFTSTISEAFYSPEDKFIVLAGEHRIQLFDPVKKNEVTSVKILPGNKSIEEIKITSDNNFLVTNSYDSTIFIWDIVNKKQVVFLEEKYSSFAISGDGKTIAVIRNEELSVYNIKNKIKLYSQKCQNSYISLNNTGQFLSIENIWGDATTTIIDIQKNEKLSQKEIGSSFLFKPKISSNNQFLITSNFNQINLFALNTLQLLGNFSAQSVPVIDLIQGNSPDVIITKSSDSIIRVWNMKKAAIVNYIPSSNSSGFSSISPKYLIDIRAGNMNSLDNETPLDTLLVLEAETGKFLKKIISPSPYTLYAFISPDYKYLVLDNMGTIDILNFATGKLISRINRFINNIEKILFIPKSNLLLTTSSLLGNQAIVWDINTGKKYFSIENNSSDAYEGWIQDFSISSDGKKIATACNNGKLQVWDVAGKKEIKTFARKQPFFAGQFSNDSKFLVGGLQDGTLLFVNAQTFSQIQENKEHKGYVYKIAYSDNSRYMVTASNDGIAILWDLTTLKPVKTISVGTGTLTDFKNGRLYFRNNSEISVFDAFKGTKLFAFAALQKQGSMFLLPDDYYITTQEITKYISWRRKDKLFGFEQMDIKYNRPEKVLERLGNIFESPDTTLIASYRKAWEKRIKRLAIDITAFRDGYSVPEADFVNRDSIDYEQKKGTLILYVKGLDSTYKLDRFNIWVNEAPVYGQRGISIRKKNKNEFDTTISIKLSQGENRIETSITNVNGTESYRMPLIINYKPAVKQKEITRFIGIGIDQFSDNKYNLQYSAKDIRDMSKKLKEKYGNDIIIDTLFNENVTISNVKALKQKLQQTTENDKVIVAYSGHGMLSKDYDYYLSTYTVNFEAPEQNGLPYDELENLLDSIPARKKLMLIDACHSGEVDKEDLVRLNASPDSLIKGIKPVAYKQDQKHLGLKNSFELMQSLFVNVGKSTGATIISAAAGTQFALERGDLKNGVFTYSILEAMNKYSTLKISELKKIVGERVEQLTNGLQKPTSRNETIAVDWSIW